MNFSKPLLAIFTFVILFSYNPPDKENNIDVDQILNKAAQQIALLLKASEIADRIPRTATVEGEMHWTYNSFDWTEGFFPGTLWYLYEDTNDET